MNVIYSSDNEEPTLLPLETLICNFDFTGGWCDYHNAEDMRCELASRGWYEGTHANGRYLVFVPGKLGCEPTPATHDAYKALVNASPIQ